MSNLIILLNDQLSEEVSSLDAYNPKTDTVLLCELKEEFSYVKHHKKKIAFWILAMREFAKILEQKGYQVQYKKIEDHNTPASLKELIIQNYPKYDRIIITQPGEYRLLKILENCQEEVHIPIEIREDNRFLCSQEDFREWAKNYKTLRMEYFYRKMRIKHNILMDGKNPIGGKWNYDCQNRKKPPATLNIPLPYKNETNPEINEFLEKINKKFSDHFGDIHSFYFATTRTEALKVLKKFESVDQ